MNELVRGLVVHFIVPVIGVLLFIFLCHKIRKQNIPHPPIVPWFNLFFTYGGFTTVILTEFLWVWSGMASLGCFYLLLVSPWIMLAQLIYLIPYRQLSLFHLWAFRLSIAWYPVLALGIATAWISG